jgi:hypothetical protein
MPADALPQSSAGRPHEGAIRLRGSTATPWAAR